MLEALNAFATAIDLERDLRDGDRFYVRYERTFTIEGNPMGVGRVLWAELRTQAKGTLAIHRFRATKTDAEAFWFANGQGTQPPLIQNAAQDHIRVVGLRPARRSVRPAVGPHRADGTGRRTWPPRAGSIPRRQLESQDDPGAAQAAAARVGTGPSAGQEPAGQSDDQS